MYEESPGRRRTTKWPMSPKKDEPQDEAAQQQRSPSIASNSNNKSSRSPVDGGSSMPRQQVHAHAAGQLSQRPQLPERLEDARAMVESLCVDSMMDATLASPLSSSAPRPVTRDDSAAVPTVASRSASLAAAESKSAASVLQELLEGSRAELSSLRKQMETLQEVLRLEVTARAVSDETCRQLLLTQSKEQSAWHTERASILAERDALRVELREEHDKRVAAELTLTHKQELFALTSSESLRREKRYEEDTQTLQQQLRTLLADKEQLTSRLRQLELSEALHQQRAAMNSDERSPHRAREMITTAATATAEDFDRPSRPTRMEEHAASVRASSSFTSLGNNNNLDVATAPQQSLQRSSRGGGSAHQRETVLAAIRGLRQLAMSDTAIALTAGWSDAPSPAQAIEEFFAGVPSRVLPFQSVLRLQQEWHRRGGPPPPVVSAEELQAALREATEARRAVVALRSRGMSDAAIALTAGIAYYGGTEGQSTATMEINKFLSAANPLEVMPPLSHRLIEECKRRTGSS